MLQHTLPAGTERAYSAACFSPDGTKLAAVGGAPDYTLTLWDWAAGVHGRAGRGQNMSERGRRQQAGCVGRAQALLLQDLDALKHACP